MLVCLPTPAHIATLIRMKAEELIRRRVAVIENGFADIVVWHVHKPVPGSTHNFKYRLAFVVDGHAYCDTTTNLEKEITGTSEVERSPIYSLIRVS